MEHRYFKPFPLPTEPHFRDKLFDIRNYAAFPGGIVKNTRAIAAAIHDCHKSGGGTVLVPEGEWLTGAIRMESNVHLHLEKGAELRFSPDARDYLPVCLVRVQGVTCYNYRPMLGGEEADNIAVTGEGILNGQGEHFWQWANNRTGLDDSCWNKNRAGYTSKDRVYGTEEASIRPYLVQFTKCKNLWLEGFTVVNSPFWSVAPFACDGVIIRGLQFKNDRKNGRNTDCVNLDSCRNCLVEKIQVLESADDCICMKSGRAYDGVFLDIPAENVVIRDCDLSNSQGGGIVIGSETAGGIKNCLVEHIRVADCGTMVTFKSQPKNRGTVENIEIHGLRGESVRTVIRIWYYEYRSPIVHVEEGISPFKNIEITDITAKKSKLALVINGCEGAEFGNIHLENIHIGEAETVSDISHEGSLTMKDVVVGSTSLDAPV